MAEAGESLVMVSYNGAMLVIHGILVKIGIFLVQATAIGESQPVYSIANGIVLFAGWNTAQGNIGLIEHTMPNGKQVWSQYAHLDRLYVSAA